MQTSYAWSLLECDCKSKVHGAIQADELLVYQLLSILLIQIPAKPSLAALLTQEMLKMLSDELHQR